MDTEAAKAAHRRAYKTNWARKRRSRIKAERGEEISLFLPHQLAADLRKLKPKGVGFRQWLVVELRHKVAKTSRPEPQTVAPISGADRNRPCPCGCGRKAKNCASRAAGSEAPR